MPTSHYFPLNYKNNSSEQNLVQDLVDEQIKLFGTDVYYLPRKNITDQGLNDIVYSEFTEKIVIEALLQNVEGVGNQSEFISKFGLNISDEITFIISTRRWDEEVLKLKTIKLENRPNEGDLIYFPLTNNLYEIKFVEIKQPFYQLGKIYFYTLSCELYQIGSDSFDTDIPAIEEIELETSYAISLTMEPGGTGTYYIGDTVEYFEVVDINGMKSYTPTGITAEVSEWNEPSRTIKLINTTGDFIPGYAILKKFNSDYQSNGTWIIDDQEPTVNIDDTNTEYDDNKYIETSADEILDFSEKNPFGEYGNLTDIF